MKAKNTHKTAGIIWKRSHPMSTKAKAIPIIIGTLAPVSVLGRAARIHAFNEFTLTFVSNFDSKSFVSDLCLVN